MSFSWLHIRVLKPQLLNHIILETADCLSSTGGDEHVAF